MDSVDRMVEAWHAQRPGMDVSQLEVVGRLLLCARHLEQALVAALKPLDLSFGDFDVLCGGWGSRRTRPSWRTRR
jgi:hypothetical protein